MDSLLFIIRIKGIDIEKSETHESNLLPKSRLSPDELLRCKKSFIQFFPLLSFSNNDSLLPQSVVSSKTLEWSSQTMISSPMGRNSYPSIECHSTGWFISLCTPVRQKVLKAGSDSKAPVHGQAEGCVCVSMTLTTALLVVTLSKFSMRNLLVLLQLNKDFIITLYKPGRRRKYSKSYRCVASLSSHDTAVAHINTPQMSRSRLENEEDRHLPSNPSPTS
jgi:hypothetical protein